MDMVAEAKKRVDLIYHWNENEYEVWEKGSDVETGDVSKGWIGDLNVQENYKEFLANAPAFIVLQSKAIEALQQDRHDLQTLVKIVELGYDDLTESLAELANMVLEYTTLPPRLLDKAREAKELAEA